MTAPDPALTNAPSPTTVARDAGVSVIMPILDEERHLETSVRAVLAQEVDGPLQVVLALGPSRDRTAEVAAELARQDERVVVVDNPSGRTPEALNAALAVARYDVIARVDGHGILSSGYLRTAVRTLAETGAANVGGIMDAVGVTPFEKAVASAMKSRIGVGGARFKLGGAEGPAETVYLGVFRRDWLRRVGGFDNRFSRAQDWELNYRLRSAGGEVWFTPDLRVEYRPRPTFRALARQYRDYGRWRRVVARQHRGSINLRYLAPPTATVGVIAGAVGGLVWRPLWAVPGAYAALVTVGGLSASRHEARRVMLLTPPVLATMHMTWGWGFLTSRIRLDDATEVRPSQTSEKPSVV